MRTIRMSASSIACFKACKMRYYLNYVLGLQPAEDTESQRVGTVWHACRELITRIQMAQATDGPLTCFHCGGTNPYCFLCGGGALPADPMDAVVAYLNRFYESRPEWLDSHEMRVERTTILHALYGYQWYYEEDNRNMEVVATELKAETPIVSPSGRAVRNAVLVLRTDALVRRNGRVMVLENKTTGRSLDPDSTYWKNLELSVQPNLYIYALTAAQQQGNLEQYGIRPFPKDDAITDCLYDVFHKPTIRPKKLSQSDLRAMLKSSLYLNTGVDITVSGKYSDKEPPEAIWIDGEPAEIEAQKTGWTIQETPGMFGTRLLQDITERPEFYFQRRIISRKTDDLIRFERELYNLYLSMRMMENQGCWYCESESCEATFRCPFIDLCYNGVRLTPEDIAAGNVPDGFRVFKREGENNG
ncbi:MAG: PD-(D/E)XK nuclease family protein [Dehalococcoidales bacterium]|nr:PD-(D/E)XK nuclease family protein [Dehalococcoidales bacterium]